MVEMSEIIMI